MNNTKTSDLTSINPAEFQDLEDTEASTVSGGFLQFAIPAAVILGTSIYMSIKHKGVVVGYDSKVADGAQKAVQNSRSGKGLFGLGFLGL